MAWEQLPLPCLIILDSHSYEIEQNTKAAQFNDGYPEIAIDGYNEYQAMFTIKYKPLTLAERTTVATFIDAKGSTKAFLWTPFGRTESLFRIVKDSVEESIVRNKYNISFKVIQQYDHG